MVYGNARAGCRTCVDALLPAAEAAEGAAAAALPAAVAAAAVAMAAEAGAAATGGMAAGAGRAASVDPALLRGVPDAGAVVAAAWLRGIARALQRTSGGDGHAQQAGV